MHMKVKFDFLLLVEFHTSSIIFYSAMGGLQEKDLRIFNRANNNKHLKHLFIKLDNVT